MTLPSAEELLAALDEDQQRVARQVTGPLAVLAGAGTGKTRAITYRLAHGVAIGAYDPTNVLAVTFTKRAAHEMKTRLRDLGVASVQARTFHSAALRQLQYFWPSAVGGRVPEIIERKASLIAAAAARVGVRHDKDAVRDYAAEIEWAKTAMVDADRYPESARLLSRETPAGLTSTQMANLIDAYENAKEERGVIDFGDVLLLTAGILEEREDIRRAVRHQYRHFIVDEYQDVSILQQHLLDLWLGERNDICVVGDVAQTIYTFAGATAHYLTSFADKHPGARVIELNRDYRSTPQIVSVANQIVSARGAQKAMPGAVRLVSQRPRGAGVQFTTYDDDFSEAQGIATRIRSYVESGVSPADIAILYRTNSQSEAFENALSNVGISYVIHGGQRFFEREEIRRALLILRTLAGAGIGASAAGSDVQSDGSAATEDTPLGQIVGDAVRELGWTRETPSAGGAVRETWDNLNALVELAHERQHLTLAQFLAEMDERIESQTAPTVDGVTLASMHASKGLEWDVVFLPGIAEGLVPISLATTPAQKQEERRLLYVAVTRARDYLHVSWAKGRGDGSRRAQRRRSHLLDGIWPESGEVVQGRRVSSGVGRGVGVRDSRAGVSAGVGRAQQQRDVHAAFVDKYGPGGVARFEALKQWRAQCARGLSKPAFAIFTDQTLRDIAAAEPKTLKQLRVIRGVGETKLEQFGGDVLRVLRGTQHRLSE